MGFSIISQILFASSASAEPPRINWRFQGMTEYGINTVSDCLNRGEKALQRVGLPASILSGEGVSRIVFGKNNVVNAAIECGNVSSTGRQVWIIVGSNDPNNPGLATTYRDNIFNEMQIP